MWDNFQIYKIKKLITKKCDCNKSASLSCVSCLSFTTKKRNIKNAIIW